MTVAVWSAANPVTVTTWPEIVAVPAFDRAAHVNPDMLFWICTVNPEAVLVAGPNSGVSAGPVTDDSPTSACPSAWPLRVVVTRSRDKVPGATPVTVTRPVPSISTVSVVFVAFRVQSNAVS